HVFHVEYQRLLDVPYERSPDLYDKGLHQHVLARESLRLTSPVLDLKNSTHPRHYFRSASKSSACVLSEGCVYPLCVSVAPILSLCISALGLSPDAVCGVG